MKVEIDVDLGPLADEWEPVAFRAGREGEHVIFNGKVVRLTGAGYGDHLIVRRKWEWPEWLTAEWIAMEEGGQWFACEEEPRERIRGWTSGGVTCCLTTGLLAFTPPPCDDWRKSKRRNPRVDKAA